MTTTTFPTKGNLIIAKNSLSLAKLGYELMDKKRNILIRELMNLIHQAETVQADIDRIFTDAYQALQTANIEMGIHSVELYSQTIPIENNIKLKLRSVMGTEIPYVDYQKQDRYPTYSFFHTRLSLDQACLHFEHVKDLIIRLSMIENSAYRLASSIKKTGKRANALKNITIPYYTTIPKEIQNALEEKEREEFTRLKVIKRSKTM